MLTHISRMAQEQGIHVYLEMVIGEVTEFTETAEKIQPLVCEGINAKEERMLPGNSKTLSLHFLSAFIAAAILNILSRLAQTRSHLYRFPFCSLVCGVLINLCCWEKYSMETAGLERNNVFLKTIFWNFLVKYNFVAWVVAVGAICAI